MSKLNMRAWVIVLLIIVAALSRLISPYNFSPLVAIALFGGSQFQKKWQAYLVPIAAYFLSDVAFALIGKTGFYGVSQFFVYGGMGLVTALGTTLQYPKALRVLGYSITGSAIFWIISNFGVWVGSQIPGAVEYEPGLTLGITYLRALPFYNNFSNTLFVNAFLGDMLYTSLLFGIFALIQKSSPALGYTRI